MLSSKFALTLVLYISLSLSIASSHANPNFHGNRLIRKRHPQGGIPAVIGAAADPASASANDPQTSASSSASSTIASTTISTSAVVSAPPSSTSVVSTTSQEVTTSTTSSSSVTSTPTSTRTSTAVPTINISTLPSASFGTVFTTSTAAAASATSSAAPASGSGKHTTITVLIVIAAAVGGIAVIWTVIRKWKFRPSSQFEDRMQPIDWQPTTNAEDGIIPGHRRMTSNSSSFLSGSHEHADNMAGRGIGGGYGAGGAADITPSSAPIPDHDFTAGPANLAPVGGYADLARGPSPQPQMQEALTRGPSINRPYDHFGHQQGYAQEAYDYNGGAEY